MNQELFAFTAGGLCLVALLGWINLPLGFAAAWVAAWLLWRRLERGLSGVKAFAEKLGSRDFEARLEGADQGSLRVALEAMAFDLKLAFDKDRLGRRRLETALGNIQDGVLLLDREGRLLFANASLERLMGRATGSGAFYWEVFREPEVNQALKQVLERRGAVAREIVLSGPAERTLFMSAAALAGGEGDEGALALFYDRTEQKKLEKMRSDFAANVSHELKTPLTAIKASLETLREGALDDPKVNRDFVDKALSHSHRLHELINDLLALASIEEDRRLGRIDRQASAGLEEALAETTRSLEDSLARHAGSLRSELPRGLAPLRIESSQLGQVLANLIENALKYAGPRPEVTVSARELDGEAEVSVLDRGPGIPLEDLPRVFERFYRVDKARARHSGGSGLGLAIVKHLIENYGGQVGVEIRPEGGCRFWFRLAKA